MIEVWFDGSCMPVNPGGVMGWGWHSTGPGWPRSGRGEVPASPGNTNNLAEYLALEAALLFLIEAALTAAPIVIRGDSQLVIRQMFGGPPKGRRWKIRAGVYAEKAREVKALLQKFTNVRGEWVPREKNTRADALSKGGKG